MPHSRRQLLAKAAIAASRVGISLSFQLDLAFDLVRQADAAERNRARGREFLVALELALRQGLADGLLDLALRAYPQHLEKFANAAVKDVFVHDSLLCWPLTTARRPLSDQATCKRRLSSMTRPPHKQPLRIMRCCCAKRSALIADHLEQIQMLSPVNHFARRGRPSRSALMVGRPRRDRYDDHRQRKNHREPQSETIWCLCHLFPLMATNRNRADYGASPGRRTVNTEPLPSSLVTVTSPPIMPASLRVMARPSPVPPKR